MMISSCRVERTSESPRDFGKSISVTHVKYAIKFLSFSNINLNELVFSLPV